MKTTTVLLTALLVSTALQAAERGRVRLALPQDFETRAEVLGVTTTKWDRAKERATLGDFKVTDYGKGFKYEQHNGSPILPPYLDHNDSASAERTKSHNKFHFTFTEAGEPRWLATCDQHGRGSSVGVKGVPVSSTINQDLRCTFADPATDELWTLSVDWHGTLKSFRITAGGELASGTTKYDVMGINKAAGSDVHVPMPVGYTISTTTDDETLAALEADSALLLPRDVPHRSLLAAASAAILLADK